MLVSVFGDPSQRALFGLRAIQILTEVSRGPYHWVCAGTADDLLAAWGAPTKKHTVFFNDIPDHRVSSLFLEYQAPMVLFIDSAARVMDSLTLERNFDLITAARVTSQSLSCLHEIALSPRCFVVFGPLDIKRISSLLPRFASVFDIPFDQRIFEVTVQHIAELSAPGPTPANTAEPAEMLEAVQRCLAGFEPMMTRKAVDYVEWPREVFLDADREGIPLCREIDLTGPARLLLFGPFLHLPKGSWTASTTFEVSKNFSGNILKIDIYYEGVIGEWECSMPKEGVYNFDLRFNIPEPRFPIQMRFYIQQGAIEGSFDLKRVVLRRI
jgi:hypothetical protein